jgi:hypothetical protein
MKRGNGRILIGFSQFAKLENWKYLCYSCPWDTVRYSFCALEYKQQAVCSKFSAPPCPLLPLTAIKQESCGSLKWAYTMKGEGYRPNQEY